jgi:hypothetical protein
VFVRRITIIDITPERQGLIVGPYLGGVLGPISATQRICSIFLAKGLSNIRRYRVDDGFRVGLVKPCLYEIPQHADDSHLDRDAIAAADLSRPILLAEISPGLYNVIDGNHRLAKARREAARTILARRIPCPQHVSFLTSLTAYEAYVEYWNSKVDALQGYPTRTRRRRITLQERNARRADSRANM